MADEETKAEKQAEEKPSNMSQEEFKAAFDGAAPLANKVIMTISPTMARLAFLETAGVPPEPYFRTAVTLSINDLVELRNLIDRMVEGKLQPLPAGKGAADA